MIRNLFKIFDRGIEFLFYAILFLVPIVFAGSTSELFEFNKMWITFGATALIAFFWLGKMVINREFKIQRTPLDIFILLFLISQIISTIFSLDSHISLWGYYSRFNGGLLSTISYIVLYYAFVSNFMPKKDNKEENKRKQENLISTLWEQKIVRRMLYVSIASGVFVSLWGLPSHFGYDPTCLYFRGNLDVACWTADFQPKIRIFSTLGQPDWLAAYLIILLPVSLAFCVNFFNKAKKITSRENILAGLFGIISILFYVDLLFTRARSGIVGFLISFIAMFALLSWKSAVNKNQRLAIIISSSLSAIFLTFSILKSSPILGILFLVSFLGFSITTIAISYLNKGTYLNSKMIPVMGTVVSLLVFTFLIGISMTGIDKFSLSAIQNISSPTNAASDVAPTAGELGGTDSGKIRLIVWRGALNIWKNNPIFGTGVETFAFAYYKYRPAEHNLTSEWNFLYNKAHNEFLNYMATTGSFGILSYLSIIVIFLVIFISSIFPSARKYSSKVLGKLKADSYPYTQENQTMIIALGASFISILVTNFFGFSVVITNIYLFLIPAFVLLLIGNINPNYFIGKEGNSSNHLTPFRWAILGGLAVPTVLIIYFLINSWRADNSYALGFNLGQAGAPDKAYQPLHQAVTMRKEPVFENEVSSNDAILAVQLISQTDEKNKDQNQAIAQSLASEAIALSNDLTTNYPNNILFWKTKVRIYYTLSQVNASYLPLALQAIQKTSALAPTEASIQYNLGVLTYQNNNLEKAAQILENTVKLKPDYVDARFALGLVYRDLGVDKNQKVINADYKKKAEDEMNYILTNLEPNYSRAKDALSAWNGTK